MTGRLAVPRWGQFIVDDGASSATATATALGPRDTTSRRLFDFPAGPQENVCILGEGYESIWTRHYQDCVFAMSVANAGAATPQSWKGFWPSEENCAGTRAGDAAWWTSGLELGERLPGPRDERGHFEIARSGPEIPRDVWEFADRLGVRKQLNQSIQAARRHFASLSSLRAYLDWDPEDAEEYIVVEANSTGRPDEDTQSYMNYLNEWSANVEWPASQMVRLDLNWPALNAKR